MMSKAIMPVSATSLILCGQDSGRILKLDPDGKYLIFVNADLVNIEELCKSESLPPETTVYACYLKNTETLDDVVRVMQQANV